MIRHAVLWLTLAAVPAAAQTTQQTSPQPGVLRLPQPDTKTGTMTTGQPAGTQATPPRPAPVTPVQRVPSSVAHAPAAPRPAHKAGPTPVVLAPPNVHAQRAAPAAVAVAPVIEPPAKPVENKGTVTGMKLPRWAALRADDVNLRVGPGTRFPIDWQYHRRDLPVQILREVEVWRLIRDQDGVKGWVHQATLIGRRGLVVRGGDTVLRATASEAGPAVANLKTGVVGRIRACASAAAWCEVQVEEYRGWLRREQFWGTDPDEAVGN